jgi:hypothetical protein
VVLQGDAVDEGLDLTRVVSDYINDGRKDHTVGAISNWHGCWRDGQSWNVRLTLMVAVSSEAVMVGRRWEEARAEISLLWLPKLGDRRLVCAASTLPSPSDLCDPAYPPMLSLTLLTLLSTTGVTSFRHPLGVNLIVRTLSLTPPSVISSGCALRTQELVERSKA